MQYHRLKQTFIFPQFQRLEVRDQSANGIEAYLFGLKMVLSFVSPRGLCSMPHTEKALVNFLVLKDTSLYFPGGTVDENPPFNIGDGSDHCPGTFHIPWGN